MMTPEEDQEDFFLPKEDANALISLKLRILFESKAGRNQQGNNYNITNVAKAIGYSRTTVSDAISPARSERYHYDAVMLWRIAKVFGVDVNWFFTL